ncbi:hypothetical protein CBR_g22075 [Chara braunii]|uniref:Uncharacterized protein n=1 Tax=Chara braunii TaxID=69332 RepID=A0A388L241_CHABU|nr:hypothetical protein CBR_g22075 [Chara braunii]|eukprot:GBG76328.1 hypothetical protein CBR_g22075 [Chara braunii]
MKAFDVRGNGTEFQMLDREKFLSKTNGYRVTGSLPIVDSAFMLTRPLVQFNSPTDQLAAFVMRYREEFARLPAAQQVDRVFVPIDAPPSSAAGPKRCQDQPARAGGKRKQLPTAPFSSAAVVQALPAPVPPSDRQGRDAAEQSSEATNYDDGVVRYRAGPQHRSRGGAGAFNDEECEGQDGEGGGWDGEGGGEEGEGGGEEEEGGGVEEARQGAGLGPTEVMYKETPFHFKVFIYTTIDKLDMLRAEVKRIASSARHLVWDKLSRQTTLLPVCMRSKEVMAAPVDIVAAAQKMACRAAIVDISAADFSSAWTSQDFDALYAMMTKCCGPNWVLFFFAPQNVQSDVLRQLYRWEDIELIPGSWKRVDRPPSDVTRYNNIATSSRDLMAIVLHAEGGDLKKVTVAPRLHNDLTEVHVVEEKFGKCLGKHGGVEGDERAAYSIWEREPGKLRKLCGSFVGEAEGNNVIACDESAKDIAYLTKFVDILVKDGRFECRLEKPRATHRTNRDMYHKLGLKRLKVWEYLFRDAPDERLDGGYIYRKTKVTEALKHYHGALTGAFETFVARCEILRFDLHKDKQTFKDCADLAKSGEGFNPVDSEEDSSNSDLEIEKNTNATGWCGKSTAMEHNVKGYGPGQSEGCSNLPPANSVASGVDRVVCTPVEDDEDDDLDILAQPTKLAPGDPIPPRFCADANNLEYSHKFYELQSSPSYGKIDWKVERAVALESVDVDSQKDVAPVPEAATGNTMGGQREDGGTTFGVKPPLPEAGNTPAGKNTIGVISVATGDTSQGEKVSLDKPADAGATYGSLLATGAALASTSEMVSESTAGMGVTRMSLHPPTCTSKGDAHYTTTPQGGVTGDDGNGGDAGGSPRSRNIEDMTTDDEDGVEGGKGVSDPTRAENEG